MENIFIHSLPPASVEVNIFLPFCFFLLVTLSITFAFLLPHSRCCAVSWLLPCLSQSPQEHILLRHHTELGKEKEFLFFMPAESRSHHHHHHHHHRHAACCWACCLRCVTLFYGTAAEAGDFMPLVCLIIFYYYSISYLRCVIAGIEENHSLSFPITRPSLYIIIQLLVIIIIILYSLLLRITFNESF